MDWNKRFILLTIIMTVVVLMVGTIAIGILYNTSFEQGRARLVEIAQSQARIMEAMARFHSKIYHKNIKRVTDLTISQVRDAHKNFVGFGKTGEFTLAELKDQMIVFMLSHRHYDFDTPEPVPFKAIKAEPMRRALSGLSGTVIGLDYRSELVLAAYEPVAILKLGIVAKIDLKEIREPFVRAIISVMIIAFILIFISIVFFYKVSKPLINDLNVLAKFPNENPNPVFRVSDKLKIIYANEKSIELMGKMFEFEKSNPLYETLPLVWHKDIKEVIDSRKSKEIEMNINSNVYSFTIAPVSDTGSVYIYGRDITRLKRAMRDLRLNAAVFENTMEGIMITDADGDISLVNPAFTEITGYKIEEALGQNPRILKSGRHDRDFYFKLWKTIAEKGQWKGEIWNRRKNGEIYPQQTNINAIKNENGDTLHFVAVFSDITEKKKNEELLQSLSITDSLTGLSNRRHFDEVLKKEWNRAKRSGGPFTLIMIDIDYFKQFNDSYGHQKGDQCLKQVASVLMDYANRPGDLAARYGGEEFAVILPLIDSAHALQVAEKIRFAVENLEIPHEQSKTSVHVTISLGIASRVPAVGSTPEDSVKMADEALYIAKEKGRNRVFMFEE